MASLLVYLTRSCLSIAIVSMVSSNMTVDLSNNSDICPFPDNFSTEEFMVEGEFDWDETIQGILLGGFFYGYLVTNFFGGLANEYTGGRWMMVIVVLGPSVMSILSPICARTSLPLFIAVRIFSGLAQGPFMSCEYALMASWIPPQEKAKLNAFIATGPLVGTMLSMAVGGQMIGSGFLGGWPSVFYVFGFLGVLWTLPWVLLVRDNPEEHPSISSDELRYIQSNSSTLKQSKRVNIPWRQISRSLPFWSLVAVSWANNYGFYNLLTEIPTYLKNIQHFGIESNGLLSAFPYLIAAVVSNIWGFFVTHLISTNRLTVLQVRKLSSSIAMFGAALGLVVICFADCNSTLAIGCLCFSMGVLTACNSGGDISEQEIAPNLAGVLKGITNTFGSLTGILAPLLTGAITSGNQTLSAWRTVFLISAIQWVVGCMFYLVFGTNKVQPWNEPKSIKKLERY